MLKDSAGIKANSGVYGVSADVNFKSLNTNNQNSKLMYAKAANGDDHFRLSQINGALYAEVYTDFADSKNRQKVKIIDNISADKWYNLTYTLNTSTGRLHFYVNGIEACGDFVLYSMANNYSLLRVIAIDAKTVSNYNGTIAINNLEIYKDELATAIAFDSKAATKNISLPSIEGVTWTSDNEVVLNTDGTIGSVFEETYVTLTAQKADANAGTASREYMISVRPDTDTIIIDNNNAEAKLYKSATYSQPAEKLFFAAYKEGKLVGISIVDMLRKGCYWTTIDTKDYDAGEYQTKAFVINASNLVPLVENKHDSFTITE